MGTIGDIAGGAFGPIGGAIGSVIGSYFGSQSQSDAANKAAAAQQAAIQQGLTFQNNAYGNALGQQQINFLNNQGLQLSQLTQGNELAQNQQANLGNIYSPLQAAGMQGFSGLSSLGQSGLAGYQNALGGQQALSGALGNDAQAQAIAGIQNSPLFSSLSKQGEDAILQNASATGGLRGGNTQAALAQFQPQLLNQLLQQQFTNLGSLGQQGLQGAQAYGTLGQIGQAGASGLAQGGLGILQNQLGLSGQIAGNLSNASGQYGASLSSLSNANSASIADLIGQQGQSAAGNALAQGQANAGFFNTLGGSINQANLLSSLQSRYAQPAAGPAAAGFGAALPNYTLPNYTPQGVGNSLYFGGLSSLGVR